MTRRFLRLDAWRGTERITMGGGLHGSRVGELAIGRTAVLLRGEGITLELLPVRHDPDEAGLVGAAHLFPRDWLDGGDALLTANIGGTNMRVALVALGCKPDLANAAVVVSDVYCHREDKPNCGQAVARLAAMLRGLADQAAGQGLHLAPCIGVGCPGLVRPDGTIEHGGHNLPGGTWEEPDFSLSRELEAAMSDGRWRVLLHNDAVVQGLSQAPWMRDVRHWGMMPAGTGLSNARFTDPGGPAMS